MLGSNSSASSHPRLRLSNRHNDMAARKSFHQVPNTSDIRVVLGAIRCCWYIVTSCLSHLDELQSSSYRSRYSKYARCAADGRKMLLVNITWSTWAIGYATARLTECQSVSFKSPISWKWTLFRSGRRRRSLASTVRSEPSDFLLSDFLIIASKINCLTWGEPNLG